MGSTRQTVASGCFDEAFLREAEGAARGVVGGRPTPTGSYSWSDEDIRELVLEAITRVGPAAIVPAAAQAATDAKFKKWLKTRMRMTLDARARELPSGRLRRAIDEALREDPEQFCSVSGCWQLASDGRTAKWHGRRAELVRVAWTVEITNTRISRSAEKTPRLGGRKDIRAVCAAVLAVSGPIDKSELAEVIAERFNAVHEAYFGYYDLSAVQEDPPDPSPVSSDGEAVADTLVAEWMFEQLTEDERTVIAAARSGAGTRELGGMLGCGKDKAATIKRRISKKIALWASELPDGGAAAVEILVDLVDNTASCVIESSGA